MVQNNKSRRKIKLIVVDFYGVMTHGNYRDTCQWLAKKYKLDANYLYDIIYHKYFVAAANRKITEEESFKGPIKELGLNEDWHEFRAKHLSFQKLNQQVFEFCHDLQKQGYNILLLSRNTPKQFEEVVKKMHMRWYFKNFINAYDLNLDKPSPQMIQYILKKFKVKPEEVIMVDDQDFNLVEPKKIGVYTILYKNFSDFKKQLMDKLKQP